jgi:hypothetical protein
LSPDNELVPLVLLSIGAIALEPLRAALSALAFAEARARNDGADLHAAIQALETPSENIVRGRNVSTLLVLLLGLAIAAPAFAEPTTSYRGDARDVAVQTRL